MLARFAIVGWMILAVALSVHAATPVIQPGIRLRWHTNENLVSADIKSAKLPAVLQRIASTTGWKVYIEPGTTRDVSAKFRNLAPGDALRSLLGDLNFALIPGSNAVSRLFVFRTTMGSATEAVTPSVAEDGRILNELVVRLKPGAKIEDVARLLGAKVVGKIDGLNAYRLRFETVEAAEAARGTLAANPSVASVDNNYLVERPPTDQGLASKSAAPVQLQMKPPSSNGKVVIGLVDTTVQSLGGNLDSFLQRPISVAGGSSADSSSPTHGTAMAETILRSLEAISKGATSVQILPVDVYGQNPATSTFEVANGIIQAVNNGATIVNLSLGSDVDSPFLHSVIQQAVQNNITVLAAAGNEPVTTPFYPAAYPEVLAVTAVENGQVADYANRGSFISLGAPGTSVIYYNGQPYYVTGTSAASAFISGIAGGYLETGGKTPEQMRQFLKSMFGVRVSN